MLIVYDLFFMTIHERKFFILYRTTPTKNFDITNTIYYHIII